VTARQAASVCENGIDRQRDLDLLDSEIDAFNNLIAQRSAAVSGLCRAAQTSQAGRDLRSNGAYRKPLRIDLLTESNVKIGATAYQSTQDRARVFCWRRLSVGS
jgi:hypothetical protein